MAADEGLLRAAADWADANAVAINGMPNGSPKSIAALAFVEGAAHERPRAELRGRVAGLEWVIGLLARTPSAPRRLSTEAVLLEVGAELARLRSGA